ncbi:MAG: endolytic transglycosylase MltG [Nitrospinae bacterium]|nr:endolytic transglycosylase MltG [Nitrospinota bacterium]
MNNCENKQKSGLKSSAALLLILAICIFSLIIAIVSIMYIKKSVTTPMSRIANPKIINIPRGSDLKTVSSMLKRDGIIKDTMTFNLLAKYKYAEGNLKAGEYQLSPDMPPLHILNLILEGKVYQYPVTIPEGYNIFEIASLLNKKGLAEREKFVLLAFNRDFIESLGIEANNLEGYVFPDTYYIQKGMDESAIIKKMVDTFRKRVLNEITDEPSKRPKVLRGEYQKTGLTIHQLITLASLIEKETGNEVEKPIISAVFHNRFKKRMRLQCDPTVIYALLLKGLKEKKIIYDGNIRKEDLSIDSPYNTYRYAGLPPGPIANPGKSSIHAAIYPSVSKYIYFVSKNDGSHHFSSTIEEHNRAVRIYQINKNLINRKDAEVAKERTKT